MLASKGFTIIELLIVLTIIAIIGTSVLGYVHGYPGTPEVQLMKAR
jgi:prepilin-type N-terminal cleavage/methylation domain-containing protein